MQRGSGSGACGRVVKEADFRAATDVKTRPRVSSFKRPNYIYGEASSTLPKVITTNV